MARIKEQNVKCEEVVEEKGGAECVEWVLPHQHVGHILTCLPFKAGNFRNETHIPSNFYFSLQREECTSLDAHCIMNEFRVLLLQKQSWKVELFAKHGTAVSFSVSRSSPDSDSRLSLIPSSASYSSQSPLHSFHRNFVLPVTFPFIQFSLCSDTFIIITRCPRGIGRFRNRHSSLWVRSTRLSPFRQKATVAV